METLRRNTENVVRRIFSYLRSPLDVVNCSKITWIVFCCDTEYKIKSNSIFLGKTPVQNHSKRFFPLEQISYKV